jgi:hypothetical protein
MRNCCEEVRCRDEKARMRTLSAPCSCQTSERIEWTRERIEWTPILLERAKLRFVVYELGMRTELD